MAQDEGMSPIDFGYWRDKGQGHKVKGNIILRNTIEIKLLCILFNLAQMLPYNYKCQVMMSEMLPYVKV